MQKDYTIENEPLYMFDGLSDTATISDEELYAKHVIGEDNELSQLSKLVSSYFTNYHS